MSDAKECVLAYGGEGGGGHIIFPHLILIYRENPGSKSRKSSCRMATWPARIRAMTRLPAQLPTFRTCQFATFLMCFASTP